MGSERHRGGSFDGKERGVSNPFVAGILLLLALGVLLIVALSVGAARVPIGRVAYILAGLESATDSIPQSERIIVLSLRLPRAVMAILAGASLALSGALLQGLFRNPLASPYLLGVAGGASTGAALVLLLGVGGALLLPVSAFLGAMTAALLVLGLGSICRRHRADLITILAGVAVGSFFSAMTSYLVFRSAGSERAVDIVFWMMGGLGRARWGGIGLTGAALLVFGSAALLLSRDLDVLLLGDREAEHVGVPLRRVRVIAVLIASTLTAIPVSLVGTIGFVGLVAPHVVRMGVGVHHRYLLPLSALSGGVMMLAADTIARTALAPAELPVGIVTAFLGVPFFLFLLGRRI
jgi:iron complex transport system permease protein